MERCGFPPRRAGPEAWKFRHGAKSGRARCVRFRTQRRNPTVGTLGRGPSFELPSPPTPACSPVESLRILFSPSFPRPPPPPDGWEPSRRTSGFRGAGGAPPWRRPRSPGGSFCTPDRGNLTACSTSSSPWESCPNARGAEAAGAEPTGRGGASTCV